MAEFTLDPIREDEIRLVSIAPALDPDEPLRCILTHHRRGDDTKYAAVSYTWGDSSMTTIVNCNGCDAEVPASCAVALRTLRHHINVETLWIDAMCINQKDTTERSQQVDQMGDIYRLASHTYAYLGDMSAFCCKDSDNVAWNQLLKQPWFSRTWVIQEVLLSRHVIIVVGIQRFTLLELLQQCEARQLPLPTLLKLRTQFSDEYAMRPPKSWEEMHPIEAEATDDGNDVPALQAGESAPRQENGSSNSELQSPADAPDGYMKLSVLDMSAEDQSNWYKATGHTNLNYWRLRTILWNTRKFHAKDPRDKLFALLPLFVRPVPKLIYPDYRKTETEVYADLSTYLLQDVPGSTSYAGAQTRSQLQAWQRPSTRFTLHPVLAEAFGCLGPLNPYAMYTREEDGSDEDEILSRSQALTEPSGIYVLRRLGPVEGGNIERLPPYSRYPERRPSADVATRNGTSTHSEPE